MRKSLLLSPMSLISLFLKSSISTPKLSLDFINSQDSMDILSSTKTASASTLRMLLRYGIAMTSTKCFLAIEPPVKKIWSLILSTLSNNTQIRKHYHLKNPQSLAISSNTQITLPSMMPSLNWKNMPINIIRDISLPTYFAPGEKVVMKLFLRKFNICPPIINLYLKYHPNLFLNLLSSMKNPNFLIIHQNITHPS